VTLDGVGLEWRGDGVHSAFADAAVAGFPDEPISDGTMTAVAFRGSRPVARLSFAVREGLQGAPGRSGLIGHYAATDREAGVRLLDSVMSRAVHHDLKRILGPMNGSTWARYRLAMSPAPEAPPFLGEPLNPAAYVEHFTTAGFAPVAHYVSTVGPLAAKEPDRAGERAARMAEKRVVISPIRLTDFDAELRLLHAFSQRAFAGNPYFTPIDADAFVAMYTPLERILDPSLVLLARAPDGTLAGYLLAYPDPMGPGRLVIKTLAVDPAWRSFGLGTHLTNLVRRSAYERGHRQVIHALMHIANESTRMATDGMQLFRRYALFGRELR
jgi:ribosomal protein S18 acetylase RimI-like enzyme